MATRSHKDKESRINLTQKQTKVKGLTSLTLDSLSF